VGPKWVKAAAPASQRQMARVWTACASRRWTRRVAGYTTLVVLDPGTQVAPARAVPVPRMCSSARPSSLVGEEGSFSPRLGPLPPTASGPLRASAWRRGIGQDSEALDANGAAFGVQVHL